MTYHSKNILAAFHIVDKVCEWYETKPSQLFQRRRFREIILARQEVFYLIKNVCPKMSLASIGGLSAHFVEGSEFNHATVLHSVKSVEDRMFCDKSYKHGIQGKLFQLKRETLKIKGDDDDIYQTMLTDLILELNKRKENKELEILLMYLRKLRDEGEANTNSYENHAMEVV